ncbi:hypothetical protein V2O64_17555 [Verrucomicrobiaceae bacterium 227]
MGLDGAELAMAVEESFGIELSNTETAKAVSVGDIVDLAWSKVESRGDLSEDVVREKVHQHVRDYLGVKTCKDTDRLIGDLEVE